MILDERRGRRSQKTSPASSRDTHAILQVIAFYSAQVKALTEELDACRRRIGAHPRGELRVGTVDAFQGAEADVVIVSAVRAPDGDSHGRKSGDVGFLADRRRFNVALTRARHVLVLVGHAQTLRQANSDHIYGFALDAEQRGEVVEYRPPRP